MEPIIRSIKNGLALHPNKCCMFQFTGSEVLYTSLPLLIKPFKKNIRPTAFPVCRSERLPGEHQIKTGSSLLFRVKMETVYGISI
jgi:hypothetical protein